MTIQHILFLTFMSVLFCVVVGLTMYLYFIYIDVKKVVADVTYIVERPLFPFEIPLEKSLGVKMFHKYGIVDGESIFERPRLT
jgi:hypothetical protein